MPDTSSGSLYLAWGAVCQDGGPLVLTRLLGAALDGEKADELRTRAEYDACLKWSGDIKAGLRAKAKSALARDYPDARTLINAESIYYMSLSLGKERLVYGMIGDALVPAIRFVPDVAQDVAAKRKKAIAEFHDAQVANAGKYFLPPRVQPGQGRAEQISHSLEEDGHVVLFDVSCSDLLGLSLAIDGDIIVAGSCWDVQPVGFFSGALLGLVSAMKGSGKSASTIAIAVHVLEGEKRVVLNYYLAFDPRQDFSAPHGFAQLQQMFFPLIDFLDGIEQFVYQMPRRLRRMSDARLRTHMQDFRAAVGLPP